MRGTILMFGGIILILLTAGFYLFGTTARPEPLPPYGCDLPQLRFAAAWQGTGELLGKITIENDSVKPCRIEGVPELSLRTETQLFTVQSFHFQKTPTPLTLQRGERAEAGFSWRNWCGGAISSSIFAIFTLPNYSATFTVPLLDADTTPSTRTPRCDAPEAQSEIKMGPFVPEGEPLFEDE